MFCAQTLKNFRLRISLVGVVPKDRNSLYIENVCRQTDALSFIQYNVRKRCWSSLRKSVQTAWCLYHTTNMTISNIWKYTNIERLNKQQCSIYTTLQRNSLCWPFVSWMKTDLVLYEWHPYWMKTVDWTRKYSKRYTACNWKLQSPMLFTFA